MRTAPRRAAALVVPAALILAILTSFLGLLSTGALAGVPLVPASPLVTWGIPAMRALHHLGLLLTIGAGGTALLLMPGPGRSETVALRAADGDRIGRGRVLRLGAAGAALWSAASLVLIPLGALEAAGAGAGVDLWELGLGTELGRIQLAVAILAGLAALCMGLARTTVAGCWGLAFAGIGTLCLGLAGHAGASLDHLNAVDAMALHLAAVAVWGGGLLVIGLVQSSLAAEHASTLIRRFSPWALGAVAALALSGLLSASLRLGSPVQLLSTAYGRLILIKAVLLVGLAVLGALQRRRLGDRVRFRHLAMTEGTLIAVVIGVSIALGRSAPPVPQAIPPVGELRVLSLLGFEPPAQPFSLVTLFTGFQPDWVSLMIAAAAAGAYLAGVIRLRRRGDAWSPARTIPFLLGCLAFAWVMNGGPAAYGRFRFDAHMVQHMAMMMIVPPLWAVGGPVTLLSRAVAPRTDGSRGVREWVLAALHSGYAQIVSSPPVAGVIFAGSLVLFYFTPLFELAQQHHAGHVLMTVHFLASGYLFAWVLIGVDPATRPINPMLRLMTLLITLSFHAFFGVAVVSATWIIAEGWYTELGMYDLAELTLIQKRGGSIMWGISEVPTLIYAIVLALGWVRSDARRARQWDRKADRDGGAELEAYNAYLASLRGEGAAAPTPVAGEQAEAVAEGEAHAPRPAEHPAPLDGPGS
ncbi:cytochrome c oxidase assembly protein [Brachybacterium hainanense]|uniref:Cytochrome c oxidase assembly protein n=1 Tax=Brachybacterium hainanense TaxID=1541174 RepID=A0ABV6R7E5_9MICO